MIRSTLAGRFPKLPNTSERFSGGPRRWAGWYSACSPSTFMGSEAPLRGDHGSALRVVVAASHAAVRRRIAEGLRRASGIALLDEARDRAELERSLSECNPSIVVLVDPLRGCVELEGLGTIRTLSPTSRTIVMAEAPADAAAVVALKQGARGYCALTTDPAVLGKAIQLVQQGEIWVGRKIVPR